MNLNLSHSSNSSNSSKTSNQCRSSEKITLSIIIPLAVDETAGQRLTQSLDSFNQEKLTTEVLWMVSDQPTTRAKLLNEGAKRAKGDYLWFLHADSLLAGDALESLIQTINRYPNGLIYFDLAFEDHSQSHWQSSAKTNSFLIKINSVGANLRSKLFKLPFGDQGFCLSKALFNQLKGYPEYVLYGEDHLLVWRAKFQGLKIISTGTTLTTSARKYHTKGWLKTTLIHQFLFFRQLIFVLLNKNRL